MNKEGYIDLEKISNSIETLSSIMNVVNLVNLSDYFEEIEKKFRQINFEHDNCLNYKQSLNIIYSNLERIKKKINELTDALVRTKQNYTRINTFSEGDIKEFSEIYKTTSASEELAKLVGTPNQIHLSDLTADLTSSKNITTIPTPETNLSPQKEPIDTVPIGIAIGATGVAGSIGAVVVDNIYDKREKHQVRKNDVYLEEYKDDNIMEEKQDPRQNESDIAQGPYHAVRFAREVDHFYGNQLDKLKLEDNDKDYLDEDEDDYEDF